MELRGHLDLLLRMVRTTVPGTEGGGASAPDPVAELMAEVDRAYALLTGPNPPPEA